MAINKISFAYPTLLRPGLVVTDFYHPEMVITNPSIGKPNSLIVTAGLLLTIGEVFINEVDVLYNDHSVIDKDAPDGKQKTPLLLVPEPNQLVSVSSMEVEGVWLNKTGPYAISIKLFHGNDDYEKIGEPVHELKSYFYVLVHQENNK